MLLTDELIAFLEAGNSVTLCSRSATLIPSTCRAKGCRVLRGERPRLRVLISAAEAGEVVDDVRNTHAVSATFGDVRSNKTLQFKGRDGIVDLPAPEDLVAIENYAEKFAESLAAIGFERRFTHCFLVADAEDHLVVEFTPADAYLQTPGPNAGSRLAGT